MQPEGYNVYCQNHVYQHKWNTELINFNKNSPCPQRISPSNLFYAVFLFFNLATKKKIRGLANDPIPENCMSD